jgi:hypothetical protein
MDTAIINFIKQTATNIIESGQEHQPTLFPLTPSGIGVVGLAGFPSKDMFVKAMTAILHQVKAYGYILVNEAWQAEAKDEGEQERLQKFLDSGKGISDLPLDDRVEILIITCYQIGEPLKTLIAKINNRRVGEFTEMVESEDMKFEGRMVVRNW